MNARLMMVNELFFGHNMEACAAHCPPKTEMFLLGSWGCGLRANAAGRS